SAWFTVGNREGRHLSPAFRAVVAGQTGQVVLAVPAVGRVSPSPGVQPADQQEQPANQRHDQDHDPGERYSRTHQAIAPWRDRKQRVARPRRPHGANHYFTILANSVYEGRASVLRSPHDVSGYLIVSAEM